MPSVFVVVVVRTLVSVLVAVTVPPGTLAPDGSLALPVMEAVIVCAGARLANRHSIATSKLIFLCIRLLLIIRFVDRFPYREMLITGISSRSHRKPAKIPG